MDAETLTAPLPPVAEAALARIERALAAPVGDGMSPADRAAHAEASYVRVGRAA
ncbi:hypothetical protein ACIQVR_39525 [Streptomyces xanthochromogenes]|uniref:hypothetical protein n=1 Tax=Streptomyces xanthochromogenes TaxID=67384 RepID=UPI00382D3C06